MTATQTITVDQALEAVAELMEDRAFEWGAVDADTRLDELGLDSLEFAELFMILGEMAGGPVDPRSAEGMVVVGDLPKVRTL